MTICAAVIGLILMASSPLSARANEAKPGLWKLADADTTIYLFGTVHALPKDYIWRTPAVETALAASRELVLEVVDTADKASVRGVFAELATSPGLAPLIDRVPEKKRAQLTAMLRKIERTPAQMTPYESWAVSLILVGAMLRDIGLEPQSGVEDQLTALFTDGKKPITGLETTRDQLGFFDRLSEKAQRFLLLSMIDDSTNQRKQFDAMVAAWRSGNDKSIAATFSREFRSSPELLSALLGQRNTNWTEQLVKKLDTPGTIFVAVGAGHLAGKQSVQTMLKARRLKVTRVQ